MHLKAFRRAKHSPGAARFEISGYKDCRAFHIEAFLERLKAELRQKAAFEGVVFLFSCPARK
jgi:7-cyano-7-deazaguanine synthase in queuosine biosynthesis